MVSNQQRLEAAEGHVSGQANKPLSNTAHALTSQQVIQELSTDATRGLSSEEAARLLGEYGANDLGKEKGISPIRIFISQIANAMTFVRFLYSIVC
jgi:magnesium-transporting ATPase (P-type)